MKVTDLTFYKDIPGITVKEYREWKSMFDKLLKVGVELEFNLHIKKGTCKGFNVDCICSKYDECKPIPCIFTDADGLCTLYFDDISRCEHANAKLCEKGCNMCEHAKRAKCNPIACATYIPVCIDCARNTVDCNNCSEYVYNKIDPNILRDKLSRELSATNNFGKIGKTGVLQVVGDGSLVNRGLEIPTVGRRYDFDTFRDMLSKIIAKAVKVGGYLNSRCSVHVHLLTEYYTKISNNNGQRRHPDDGKHLDISGLERPFPNIFLFNLIQIWRKYEVALFWMGMGLSDANHMTRWTKFRYPLLEFNPMNGLHSILQSVNERVGNSRYSALNIKNTNFDGHRFHIEVRIMDFVKSPTYISAMCALYKALVMRAIDISVFGVMDVDNTLNVSEELALLHEIANGYDKGYDSDRLSVTSYALKYQDIYIKKCYELLDFVAPALRNNQRELAVLKAIAERPPALHLITADCEDPSNNFDIESVYGKYANNDTQNELNDYLRKVIALGIISNCKTQEEWIQEIYEEYMIHKKYNITQLKRCTSDMVHAGEIIWDNILKTYKCT